VRLAALDLVAFGRFTDTRLAFTNTSPDFHLLYGANEAGKTTALEAVRALLYGIPERTPYAFLHPNTELRVAGELAIDGAVHAVVRRKGRKNTLQDPSGRPLDDAMLGRALAAMEREQFQRMFALTHGDLVAGGEEIVEGKGDAGQALFGAGQGGMQLAALLRGMQEEADGLFRPRASTRPLNEKLGRLRDLDKQVRDRQLSGDQWAKQQREASRAAKQLAETKERLEALGSEQTGLRRLQRTVPLLGKLAQCAEQLAQLGDVIALPDDFDERRRKALQQEETASRSLETLGAKLEAAREKAAGIEVPEPLLQRAAEIKELQERLGGHSKGEKDSVGLRAKYRAHVERATELLAKLPGSPILDEAISIVPDIGVQTAVEDLASRRKSLDEALRAAAEELETCGERISEAQSKLEQLPEERDSTLLRQAVSAARRRGDLEATLAGLEDDLAKSRQAAESLLAQLGLWQGELPEAMTLSVPLDSTVQDFSARFRKLEDEGRRLAEREAELSARQGSLQQDLDELGLAGAVPLETDLLAARETREEGWQLIKRRYLMGQDVDLTGYAPAGDADAVYEGHVQEADTIADRLRRESQRVHQRAQLESDLNTVAAEIEALTQRRSEHAAACEGLLEQWGSHWAPAGMEPLSPDEMKEWLARLVGVRTAAERVADLTRRRDEARAAVAEAAQGLADELAALSEDVHGAQGELGTLLQLAETVIDRAATVSKEREQLTRDLERALPDQTRRRQAVEKARHDLQQWALDWEAKTASLRLGDQPTAAQGLAVLRVYREVADEHGRAAELQRRLEGIEREANQFSQDVQRLTGELAPDLTDLAPADATRELQSRLTAGGQARASLQQLSEQIAGHEEEVLQAREALLQARRELAALAALAQCDVSLLQTAWERHEAYVRLSGDVDEIEGGLATAGDGKSLAELRVEAEGADLDGIGARLATLEAEAEALGGQRDQQQKDLWELQHALKAMDGNDEASVSADERQALIADLRDDADRYLTLAVARQLLSQAIAAYREENQGPLLQRAGELFSRVTGGAFAGLATQYGDSDDPILVGVRASGGPAVAVEGMSDGTCDQLFLALRLAAIEQHSRQSEPLPLIVDDILIRFDDDRARATLEALGEMAMHCQVIFFTHHRRIQQLADDVFGKDGYGRIEL